MSSVIVSSFPRVCRCAHECGDQKSPSMSVEIRSLPQSFPILFFKTGLSPTLVFTDLTSGFRGYSPPPYSHAGITCHALELAFLDIGLRDWTWVLMLFSSHLCRALRWTFLLAFVGKEMSVAWRTMPYKILEGALLCTLEGPRGKRYRALLVHKTAKTSCSLPSAPAQLEVS